MNELYLNPNRIEKITDPKMQALIQKISELESHLDIACRLAEIEEGGGTYQELLRLKERVSELSFAYNAYKRVMRSAKENYAETEKQLMRGLDELLAEHIEAPDTTFKNGSAEYSGVRAESFAPESSVTLFPVAVPALGSLMPPLTAETANGYIPQPPASVDIRVALPDAVESVKTEIPSASALELAKADAVVPHADAGWNSILPSAPGVDIRDVQAVVEAKGYTVELPATHIFDMGRIAPDSAIAKSVPLAEGLRLNDAVIRLSPSAGLVAPLGQRVVEKSEGVSQDAYSPSDGVTVMPMGAPAPMSINPVVYEPSAPVPIAPREILEWMDISPVTFVFSDIVLEPVRIPEQAYFYMPVALPDAVESVKTEIPSAADLELDAVIHNASPPAGLVAPLGQRVVEKAEGVSQDAYSPSDGVTVMPMGAPAPMSINPVVYEPSAPVPIAPREILEWMDISPVTFVFSDIVLEPVRIPEQAYFYMPQWIPDFHSAVHLPVELEDINGLNMTKETVSVIAVPQAMRISLIDHTEDANKEKVQEQAIGDILPIGKDELQADQKSGPQGGLAAVPGDEREIQPVAYEPKAGALFRSNDLDWMNIDRPVFDNPVKAQVEPVQYNDWISISEVLYVFSDVRIDEVPVPPWIPFEMSSLLPTFQSAEYIPVPWDETNGINDAKGKVGMVEIRQQMAIEAVTRKDDTDKGKVGVREVGAFSEIRGILQGDGNSFKGLAAVNVDDWAGINGLERFSREYAYVETIDLKHINAFQGSDSDPISIGAAAALGMMKLPDIDFIDERGNKARYAMVQPEQVISRFDTEIIGDQLFVLAPNEGPFDIGPMTPAEVKAVRNIVSGDHFKDDTIDPTADLPKGERMAVFLNATENLILDNIEYEIKTDSVYHSDNIAPDSVSSDGAYRSKEQNESYILDKKDSYWSDKVVTHDTKNGFIIIDYINEEGMAVRISQPKGVRFLLRRLYEMFIGDFGRSGSSDDEAISTIARSLKRIDADIPQEDLSGRLNVFIQKEEDIEDVLRANYYDLPTVD